MLDSFKSKAALKVGAKSYQIHRLGALGEDQAKLDRLPISLKILLENLLRNAVRYAQDRVTVTVTTVQGQVAIDVGDDGPGIPGDQRTRVLNPFVRLDGSHTRAHRGLGLGLAIVRRIVEAHGGSVTISESPERGTLVRTLWPT